MTIQQVTELGLKYLSESEESVVPSGYKQTEVGVIPEDWKIVCLDQLSEKIMVGIASAATHAYRNRGIPFLRNQNILPNKLDETDILFITPEYELAFQNKRLKAGDLLTARTGYPGTTCIIPESYSGAQSFTTLITRLKVGEAIPQYVSAYMNSESGEKFFELNQIGGGQKNVNSAILKTLPLPLPSVKEQTAIANALFDIDALIGELEKLITKKQAIKTATMQQLLTGRIRLPQFALHEDGSKKGYKQSELGAIPEDWEVVRFGELFEPEISRKSIKPSTLVSFIGMQDVTERAKLANQSVISYEKVKSGFTYFERGDVLLAKITPCFENGKGCHAENLETENGFGSTEFHVLRATEFSDSKFIYFWTTRNNFRADLESEMVGSAGHRRVPLSAISNYKIHCPPNKQEQTDIATILSDMDNELQALEQRLSKTRQIKQGMMQELLTGKTRLVKPEDDHHGSA